jgi:dTDP-4-dehydrorhamnose 3,5-epimerase-like enzyme
MRPSGPPCPPRTRSRFFDGRILLLEFEPIAEPRGALLPVDFEALPFFPKRAFVVDRAPPGTTRAGHAQRRGYQLLLRLSGQIAVTMRLGGRTETVALQSEGDALLIEEPVWKETTYRSPDAVLLVFSSEVFRPEDQIREET